MSLRLLVCEGNVAERRRLAAFAAGPTCSEAYAATLRDLVPGSSVDIVFAADPGALLPAPLDGYDGVAITGSILNIHRGEPASRRQIDLAREVFAAGVPFFGSCWGLQVATVAAGGEVVPNPRGREAGFARGVSLTAAGRDHPMHAGREDSFDAPAFHSDIVSRLPKGATVTASNALAAVQAAEIRYRGGTFWGVQYHPEYMLADVATLLRLIGQTLVDEHHFADRSGLAAYAADLDVLHGDATRADIARRLGLGDELLDQRRRLCEIANWLEHQVLPTASARGRR